MEIKTGYKYRIYPTNKQITYFTNCFGCKRFIWNYFLDKTNQNNTLSKNATYNYYAFTKELASIKRDLPWLKMSILQCYNKL